MSERGASTPTKPFRLLRARDKKMIGGVAAGIGKAAGVDPTLARLAILGAFFASFGFALVAYIVGCVVIPQEDPEHGEVLQRAPARTAHRLRIGLLIAGIWGAVQILSGVSNALWFTMFPHTWGGGHRGGPGFGGFLSLMLIGGGVLWLITRHRYSRWDTPTTPNPPSVVSSYSAGDGGVGVPTSGWTAAAARAAAGRDTATRDAVGRDTGAPDAWADDMDEPEHDPLLDPLPPYEPYEPSWSYTPLDVVQNTSPSTPGSLIAARVVGWLVVLWSVAVGLIGAGLWWAGAITPGMAWLSLPLGGLAFSGLLFALMHAKRPTTILLAIGLLAIPFALASRVTWYGDAGVHDEKITVTSLRPSYRLAAGQLALDMRRLKIAEGTKHVAVDVSVGQVIIRVPRGVNVDATASARLGQVTVFGADRGGSSQTVEQNQTGCPGSGTLVIDANVRIGHIEILGDNTPPVCPSVEAPAKAAA